MTTTTFICYWFGFYDVPCELEAQEADCGQGPPMEGESDEEPGD